jgi:hypothetical protein
MRALAIAAVLAALLAPQATMAGTTGELTGTVIDGSTGAPIAGATVTIEAPAQRESAVSDSAGHFSFVSLVPGTYTITAARSGFGDTKYTVYVAADTSSRLPIALQHDQRWIGRGIRGVHRDYAFRPNEMVRAGIVPDVYVVLSSWPYYDVNGTDIYAIHFIPGLTFGSGTVMAR